MPLQITSVSSRIAPGLPRRQPLGEGFGNQYNFLRAETLWTPALAVPARDFGVTPAAFQLPQGDKGIILAVDGVYPFGDPWTGRQYRLVARSGGANAVTIHSSWAAVPVPAGAFRANHFKLGDAVLTSLPFRVAGDWTWTIEAQGLPALSEQMAQATRLEFYIFLGSIAPVFSGVHCLEMLRLAVPDYGDVVGQAGTQAQTELRHISFVARKLWNYSQISGMFYDCTTARAHYISGRSMQSFDLGRFLAPRGAAIRKLNCYDLAAFTDLAFKALGTSGPFPAGLVSCFHICRHLGSQANPTFSWV